MRPSVRQLVELGPLPDSDSPTVKRLKQYVELLEQLSKPVRDEEARALVSLFPPSDDDCYGLAWTLLHLIESAPGWPLIDCLDQVEGWTARLRARAERGQQLKR